MKRSSIVTLTAAPDELRNLLLTAIAKEYGVTVQGCEYDRETKTYQFTCLEGLQAGRMPEVSSTIVNTVFGQSSTGRKPQINRGLKPFLNELFKQFDQWPMEKLMEACKKSGFKLTSHRLKNYVLSQTPAKEINPGVFGVK